MNQSDASGVHARGEDVIDSVAEAVRARLDRNPGDTTYFRTGVLCREDAIGESVPGQKVTAALRKIAAREGGYDGVVVEQSNPDSNKLRWTARLVDKHGGEAIMTDGGVIAPNPGQPSVPATMEDVLADARPGGCSRDVLIERVAELSGATMDDVEEVLRAEIERGDVYRMDDEIKLTPSHGVGWGR
ncbi:hypothetical protein [Halococcus sp. PRR34]|uniref:hypothetical protein n=1 Tax=Halococcus sp. PRR34 TaxID=3020830 RepID=UPI00235E3E6F|nr:hypothetical protein [Halococcus sp. PRR34]